ncbi:hypothetical protein VSR01_00205 [Actinacidiphila sp. DG2A-62]|nr:hypothetical protein [Actinacidiphila sp. DG2A-62]MEC3992051.1 hypothetical protein [Actinacidiphila sp. DG2A-62]
MSATSTPITLPLMVVTDPSPAAGGRRVGDGHGRQADPPQPSS